MTALHVVPPEGTVAVGFENRTGGDVVIENPRPWRRRQVLLPRPLQLPANARALATPLRRRNRLRRLHCMPSPHRMETPAAAPPPTDVAVETSTVSGEDLVTWGSCKNPRLPPTS